MLSLIFAPVSARRCPVVSVFVTVLLFHTLFPDILSAQIPLLPEMCLGLVLAFVAYAKVAIVLALIGFPFCFGLVFLIWIHSFCFLWWPLFFSYYIIRGVAYGVPCRLKLIMEGAKLLLNFVLGDEGAQLKGTKDKRSSLPASPQMASLSTQAAWVAASAASAAGVDAGWRFVDKDIASPSTSPQSRSRVTPSSGRVSGIEMPNMSPLPRAQIDDDLCGSLSGETMHRRHLKPMLNQKQGQAMASAG